MSRSREVAFFVGLLLVGAPQIHCALGRGLSTPEERAQAISISRSLERDPLAATAPADRQWLLNWIIDIPDIRFKSCVDLFGPAVGNQYRYSTEVTQQVVFSAAAFRLEHPDHLRNDRGAYLAGAEGALRAYERLLTLTPDARLTFLDDLVAKRDNGQLAHYIATMADERCKRPGAELLLNVAGPALGLVLAYGLARVAPRRIPRPNGAGMATTARRVVFVCAAYYTLAVTALHFLEPEFDLRFRFVSEYALGEYGWLATSTFFVLALAVFAVAVGLPLAHPSRSGRVGFGLLAVAALFISLAGVFKDSIPHLLASVVALPTTVMAVLFWSWTFRAAPGWQTVSRVTLVIGLGMLGLYSSMVADAGMPGLQQRVFLFLLLVWLCLVAHTVVRMTRTHAAIELRPSNFEL